MNSRHADIASYVVVVVVVVYSELQCNLNVYDNTDVNCVKSCTRKRKKIRVYKNAVYTRRGHL